MKIERIIIIISTLLLSACLGEKEVALAPNVYKIDTTTFSISPENQILRTAAQSTLAHNYTHFIIKNSEHGLYKPYQEYESEINSNIRQTSTNEKEFSRDTYTNVQSQHGWAVFTVEMYGPKGKIPANAYDANVILDKQPKR